MLNLADLLEQAKKDGYLRCKDSEDSDELRMLWFGYCKAHDIPVVEVREKTLYATVRLDTITCEQRVLTREGANRIRGVLYRYAEPLGASGERDIHGGNREPRPGTAIWSERVQRNTATYVAREILTIVKQEMVEWQGEGTFAEFVPLEG